MATSLYICSNYYYVHTPHMLSYDTGLPKWISTFALFDVTQSVPLDETRHCISIMCSSSDFIFRTDVPSLVLIGSSCIFVRPTVHVHEYISYQNNNYANLNKKEIEIYKKRGREKNRNQKEIK